MTDLMTDIPSPSIHVLLGRILADLPAIGKDSQAPAAMGGFQFRGIEAVKNALNPLLAKYGVFYVPLATDVLDETIRLTAGGKAQYVTRLRVSYRFYGPNGDYVEAAMFGEGSDTADKGTQKAATAAEKYMLFETFCINTEDQAGSDVDRHETEESVPSIQCRTCLDEVGRSERYPDPRAEGGDPEPYRAHMVNSHGYVRLEDGRVSKPDTAPTPDAPPSPPTPQEPEPAPAPTEPDPSPEAATGTPIVDDGDNTPAATTNPEIPQREVAFVDDLKGPAVRDQLKALGLPISGTVPDCRERLKTHLLGSPPPDAPDAPTPDDTPDDAPAPTGETWECPEPGCDVFPFARVEDYEEHWNAVHGPGGADEQAAAAKTNPATPAMMDTLREMVAGLRGAKARAYGAYRREKRLPKVEEMSFAQATDALDFIDTL